VTLEAFYTGLLAFTLAASGGFAVYVVSRLLRD
jgi:hypothetical protein